MTILDHLISGLALPEVAAPDSHGPPPQQVRRFALNCWAQLARGLASDDINAAFINIPLAMDLFERGLDITLLMFTHRAGSRMICNPAVNQLKDFQGRSILIPHNLSVQHMLVHKFLGAKGVALDGNSPGAASAETVSPALMPEMMSRDRDNDIAGFICAEPYPETAIQQGTARHLLATRDLWKDHPCCAFVVKNRVMDARPEDLQALVTAFFRAAQWIEDRIAGPAPPDQTLVDSAAAFLRHPKQVAAQALKNSGIRYAPEQLIPGPGPLAPIREYMTRTMKLLSGSPDMDAFVEPGFARTALSELDL